LSGADGLDMTWRYYKDGTSWLCKVARKKKTILWLSVWQGCFHLGFYFTEKNGAGIPDLNIDKRLKRAYVENKPIGKLKPLTVEVHTQADLQDGLELVAYRMGKKAREQEE